MDPGGSGGSNPGSARGRQWERTIGTCEFVLNLGPPKNLPFYPQKVRCSRPTLRECSPLLKITRKDQKIHFNKPKQVYPQRHGSCFAGGLHLVGAQCLFKLLFHCRFNSCNSRAADIKFTVFPVSFCFHCFESERGRNGSGRASKEWGAVF